jgi:hypothetical protein
MLGWSKSVVGSIDVGDGNARKLFLREAFQATDVYAVPLSNGGLGSDTKRTHPAAPAKEVQILASVELVRRKLGLPCQDTKVLWGRHCGPEPVRRQIEQLQRYEVWVRSSSASNLTRSTMAIAAIGLEHG